MNEVFKLYRIPIILGAISVLCVVFAIVLLVKSSAPSDTIEFSSDMATTSAVLGTSEIQVDVEGAVRSPGLYSFPNGSRVEDALIKAGGLTESADLDIFAKTMNRAMVLVDGAKLYIPFTNDESEEVVDNTTSSLISINTASTTELDTLPGVGPVTAGKIIDNRPYQTLEELVTKKAVGQSVFNNIKDQITL